MTRQQLPNLPDPPVDWPAYGDYEALCGQDEDEDAPEWIEGLMDPPPRPLQQRGR